MKRTIWIASALLLGVTIGSRFLDRDRGDEARNEAREDHEREERARRTLDDDARSPAVVRARARIAREEAERFPESLPVPLGRQRAAVPGQSWINIGPTDVLHDDGNGGTYSRVDAGRVNAVAVDPRDPNVVYVATSGGGVWKTWDFETAHPDPSWHAITEHLDNLAIGALALAPSAPDTIYVGFGDPYDVDGDSVARSTDGGSTWSTVQLSGTYPMSAGSLAVTPLSVRSLAVDAADASLVLAATDVGLFRSTDGANSFALVDLPNAGATQLAEATWSVVHLGGARWLVSGVYACDVGWRPPWAGRGVLAGTASVMNNSLPCTLGNRGDIWLSTDSGATWTSMRASAGGHPMIPADELGPIILSAAPAANPAMSTAYALIGNGDEENNKTQAVWRTDDGGTTWHNATGSLANPTTGSSSDCGSVNVAHDQAWYDLAIAVDPQNPERALIGGNLCGMRTLNGTARSPSWENISHWNPGGGRGSTAGGELPYVHADWHVVQVSWSGGARRVFVGSDGGLFSSTDVFSRSRAEQVSWSIHNRGLVTDLVTAVGSGDPADGNYPVVIAGLQDNGVIYRDNAMDPTTFHKVLGADGFDSAINKGTSGEFYLTSQYNSHYLCIASFYDCGQANSWQSFEPPIASNDEFPFVTRISAVQPNPTGAVFLTISKNAVWRSDITNPQNPVWNQIGSFDDIRNVFASQSVRRLYGVALKEGRFAVTSDAGTTWTTSAQIGVGTATVARAVSIAFPAVTPTDKQPGDVYLAASYAWTMGDPNILVPDNIGHLFYTEDRGQSFMPFHGDGTGHDLPNVPIQVVRWDPGDATNQTIYVGTDLGLYRSTDGGQTWSRFGHGLPLVRVTDLFIAKNSTLIRIGTYGRGTWELYASDAALRGAPGDGDFDRNQVIDWRDVAALASRLGTTPAQSGWPAYSWIDDLSTGAAPNRIDEDDLTLVTAKLGEHP